MCSVPVAPSAHHRLTALEANSGPLSLLMCKVAPRIAVR